MFPSPTQTTGWILDYKLGLWPGAGRARPFLNANYIFSQKPVYQLTSIPGVSYGIRCKGTTLAVGTEYQLWRQLHGFVSFGGAAYWCAITSDPVQPRSGFSPVFNVGLRYQYVLRGDRPDQPRFSTAFDDSQRWSLEAAYIREQSYPIFMVEPRNLISIRGLLAYRAHKYFSIWGGGQVQELVDEMGNANWALGGGGMGVRVHSLDLRRFSISHDIGYFRLNRPRYQFYSSRLLLSMDYEYAISNTVSLRAGGALNILRYDNLINGSAGLRVRLF